LAGAALTGAFASAGVFGTVAGAPAPGSLGIVGFVVRPGSVTPGTSLAPAASHTLCGALSVCAYAQLAAASCRHQNAAYAVHKSSCEAVRAFARAQAIPAQIDDVAGSRRHWDRLYEYGRHGRGEASVRSDVRRRYGNLVTDQALQRITTGRHLLCSFNC
jgi:hypothetical protein